MRGLSLRLGFCEVTGVTPLSLISVQILLLCVLSSDVEALV